MPILRAAPYSLAFWFLSLCASSKNARCQSIDVMMSWDVLQQQALHAATLGSGTLLQRKVQVLWSSFCYDLADNQPLLSRLTGLICSLPSKQMVLAVLRF